MYKVAKDFTDQMRGCFKYKVGDTYEEISSIWTDYLLENKFIEKVSYEKKKYEAVQKEQD